MGSCTSEIYLIPIFSRIKLLLNQITAISWTDSKTSFDALSSPIHGCTPGWRCEWSYNPPTPPPTEFKTLNKNSTKHNRVFQKHGPKKKFVINLRYPPPKFSTSVHATYAILRKLKTCETIDQWFPTTVPRNTCVPRDVSKCSAAKLIFDLFTVKLEFYSKIIRKNQVCVPYGLFFSLKCSARFFFSRKCSPYEKGWEPLP
jgi:hypothetical protein